MEQPQVLVVEDDGALRELLEDALTEEGFDVLLAADGAEALELLLAVRAAPAAPDCHAGHTMHAPRAPHAAGTPAQPTPCTRYTPSVILTDTIMPRMDGWQFIRAYRQLPPPHAPIISMGASADVEDADAPAVDAIVAKPFDLERLLCLVSRCAVA